MTHKYTQGPWKAVFKHGQSGPDYYSIVDNGGVKLCEVLATGAADLMAAAPDMLEALENLRIQLADIVENELPALLHDGPTSELLLSRLDSYTGKIAEVITKAKGEQ